jgi:hypothetical protein
MVNLDAMIERARNAAVRRDIAEARVRELERWTARSAPRRWRGWLAACGAAATAVAIAIAVMVARRGDSPDIAPIRIGDRVALVAEPGTSYRIVRAGGDDTAIEVDRGAVTARLWPGAQPHRLALQGGGVVATAKGTVYSLTVESGNASVHVDEGTVDVQVGAAVHTVTAGASWPPDRVRVPGRASSLLALAPPRRAPARLADHAAASSGAASSGAASSGAASSGAASSGAASSGAASSGAASSGAPLAAPDRRADAATPSAMPAGDSGSPPPSPIASAPPAPSPATTASAPPRSAIAASPPPGPAQRQTQRASVSTSSPPLPRAAPAQRPDIEPTRASAAIKRRWQLARQLRIEGKFRAAVAECLAIANASDPTWSPIALVEAIRLYAGPLADSAQVIALADRVVHEWPAATLVSEARQQRCRALHRLGRGGECTAPPLP